MPVLARVSWVPTSQAALIEGARSWRSRLLAFCGAPEKGTMADLGPLIRHLVSTRLPSGGRAASLSPLYGTRPCV